MVMTRPCKAAYLVLLSREYGTAMRALPWRMYRRGPFAAHARKVRFAKVRLI
jgi:hypothetical protein